MNKLEQFANSEKGLHVVGYALAVLIGYAVGGVVQTLVLM